MVNFDYFASIIKKHWKLLVILIVLLGLFFVFSQKEIHISIEDKNSFALLNESNASSSNSLDSNNSSSAHGSVSVSCSVDSDCDDGNECTFDYCDNGRCLNNVNVWGVCSLGNGEEGVCNEEGLCSKMESYCDNGVDDDGDGLIDCQDPDCEGVPCNFNGTVGQCSAGQCSVIY